MYDLWITTNEIVFFFFSNMQLLNKSRNLNYTFSLPPPIEMKHDNFSFFINTEDNLKTLRFINTEGISCTL